MSVDIWSEVEDLDGIIGAGCSVVCKPVSLMAATWNLPMVSYYCASSVLSNSNLYPTFSRTNQPYLGLVPMFNAMLDLFG